MQYTDIEVFFDHRCWVHTDTWSRKRAFLQQPAISSWLQHDIQRAASQVRRSSSLDALEVKTSTFTSTWLSSLPSWPLLDHLRRLPVSKRGEAYLQYCLIRYPGQQLAISKLITAFNQTFRLDHPDPDYEAISKFLIDVGALRQGLSVGKSVMGEFALRPLE